MTLDIKAPQIEILVNGEPREIPSRLSVAALLSHLEMPAERVAVELNKSIVRKRDWEQTEVLSDAQIEIVEFVGGG